MNYEVKSEMLRLKVELMWCSIFMSLFPSHLFVQIFPLSQVPGCSLCRSWPCQGRRWVGSQQQTLTWETMPSWSIPSWTESRETPLTSPEPTKRPWSFWTRWEECPQDIWEREKTLLKSQHEFPVCCWSALLGTIPEFTLKICGQKLGCWLSAIHGYSSEGFRPAWSFCLKPLTKKVSLAKLV